ncbi:hypothetical protein [Phaeocystidibacter marisrubri]|uniref:Uncharacterized protein n=1 Tax=Phaeocystidibacter marisrubri TaxID=1577780 RepID=A0A6L3ZH63_9FLAO|nr:hypothetical protein [Phaeocystidibacter marisrubri]KAB2817251.1 hypothetical protein F8C82_02335 [Phaeocystidibacter marisrubri]GGH76246.1 hypothetical protein GCM10011318_24220 [Phaeocystidibacter marisrubri]
MKTLTSLSIALLTLASCSSNESPEAENTPSSAIHSDTLQIALRAYADSLTAQLIHPRETWMTYAVLDSMTHPKTHVRSYYTPSAIAILNMANASISENLGTPFYNYVYTHPIEFAEQAATWDSSWEENMMRIGKCIAREFDREGSPIESYTSLKRRILLDTAFTSAPLESRQNLMHLLTLISVHLNIPVDLSTLETRTDTCYVPLSHVLTADLNGDKSPEKVSFLKEGQVAGIQIIDGKSGMLTLIGFNRTYRNFLADYSWAEDWRLVLPKRTTDHIVSDGDIVEKPLELENVSIEVRRKSEIGSKGLITFINGQYYWVHQGC